MFYKFQKTNVYNVQNDKFLRFIKKSLNKELIRLLASVK